MKKYIFFRKQSANSFMMFYDFLVFLLSPDDSTESAVSTMKMRRIARFDNRFHGALKIFFWIGFTVFFWIGLLFFFRMLL